MYVSRSKIVSARGNFFEVKNIKIAIDSYFASRFLLVCVKIGHFSITSYSSFDVGSTAGTWVPCGVTLIYYKNLPFLLDRVKMASSFAQEKEFCVHTPRRRSLREKGCPNPNDIYSRILWDLIHEPSPLHEFLQFFLFLVSGRDNLWVGKLGLDWLWLQQFCFFVVL